MKDSQILELKAFLNRSLIKITPFARFAGVSSYYLTDLIRDKAQPANEVLEVLYESMQAVRKEAKAANTTDKRIRFLKQDFIAHSFAFSACGANLKSHYEGRADLTSETERKLHEYFKNISL